MDSKITDLGEVLSHMRNLIMYAFLPVLKNPLCPCISMKLKYCKLQHNHEKNKKPFEEDPGDQAYSEKPNHRHKFACLSILIMIYAD